MKTDRITYQQPEQLKGNSQDNIHIKDRKTYQQTGKYINKQKNVYRERKTYNETPQLKPLRFRSI